MSLQTEKSGGASTLPPPELNPLLNPLLAQNMGRWAQVYFTSPPEKREEAVQELVRELEAENSKSTVKVDASSPLRHQELGREARAVAPSATVQPTLIRCHACGRKNLTTQKFCGMCGTRLGEEAAAAAMFDDRDDTVHQPVDLREELATPAAPSTESQFPVSDYRDRQRVQPLHVARLDRNELSLFQGGGDREYDDRDYDDREYYDEDANIFSTPQSGSPRVFVGLVLAIMIGVGAYLAWPNIQDKFQTLRARFAAAPAATEATAPEPQSPTKTEPPNGTTVADNKPSAPSRTPAKPAVNAAGKEADTGAPSLPHGVSSPPKANSSEAPAGMGGGEELAIAQGYLSGTNGRRRDSAEAAKWLWKSIAKHNADATLLLSDLYLKGDGVSKNCDQARVLLDSAALQGVKSAGERLRHFQAFGCQ